MPLDHKRYDFETPIFGKYMTMHCANPNCGSSLCQKTYSCQGSTLDPMDPHVPGAKLDKGKNRLGLVLGGFSLALEAIGKVGTFGAAKYSDNGWLEVQDGLKRYTDAMYRHLLKDAQGELYDPESGLPHLHHALWNLTAMVELTELELTQVDNQ